ncbi:MAG: acyltransferase [Bradyrhizobium sp.]
MFGTFRLLLAMAVVMAHMGAGLYEIHVGIVAVVCFYMISGYAMTALIESAYQNVPTDVVKFYADRFMRLAPQYYFYLAVCAFTVLALDWRETIAQVGAPNVVNVFANITIVPLTFFMFDDSIGSLMLNMPTWTIGLEMCFYLILPWLLPSRTALWVATMIGAAVWAISTHGLIHPDFYSYRLLPGTLVFFVVGVAVQRRDWPLFAALVLFFVLDAASLYLVGKLTFVWNASLLIGAALGCVTIPLLARLPRNRLDEQIGAGSYGCYLAHWIFVTALTAHRGEPWAIALGTIGSAAAGWATYVIVEAPTVRFRRELRRRRLREAKADAALSVPS